MESYYYNQLGKIRPGGLPCHAHRIAGHCPRLSRACSPAGAGQLSEIFFEVAAGSPKSSNAVRFTYRYYPQASSVEMVPEYLFEKSKIQEHQKAMAARIQKLTRPAMNL